MSVARKSSFQMEYDWMMKMMRDKDLSAQDWNVFALGAIDAICEHGGKNAIDKIQGVLRALKDFKENNRRKRA